MFDQNFFVYFVECDCVEDVGERRVCETRFRFLVGIEGLLVFDVVIVVVSTVIVCIRCFYRFIYVQTFIFYQEFVRDDDYYLRRGQGIREVSVCQGVEVGSVGIGF